MSTLRVICPKCDCRMNLAASLAGKKIRCKECKGIVAVPETTTQEDAEEKPRRPERETTASRKSRPPRTDGKRRRPNHEDDDEDMPRTTLPLVWILSGVGGLFLLVVLVAVIVAVSRPGPGPQLTLNNLPGPKLLPGGNPPPGTNPPPAPKKAVDPLPPGLPPVRPTDRSSGKILGSPAGPVTWRVAADPAPAPRGQLAAKPIPLQIKEGEVARLLFSSPEIGQAAILSVLPGDVGEKAPKPLRVSRHDLSDGKQLSEMELYPVTMNQPRITLRSALSTDGNLLAVCYPEKNQRVDVWSLADNKHLAGWMAADQNEHVGVTWMQFIDEKRLLVVDNSRNVTLWDAPECRAIYTISLGPNGAALSPGRKYFTACTGTTTEIIEAATGERVGQLNCLGSALAFRPDGKEIVLVAPGNENRPFVRRWNAVTGTQRDEFHVVARPGSTNQVKYLGPEHLLLTSQVIDCNVKWAVAECPGPNLRVSAQDSPDGRHWFADRSFGTAALSAMTLPTESMKQFAQQIAGGQITLLIAPGLGVSIRVEGALPPENPEAFRQQIIQQQTQRMQALGLSATANPTLDLVVQLQVRDTGKTVEYVRQGGRVAPGQPERFTFREQEILGEVTLTHRQAGQLWTQKNSWRTNRPPDFFQGSSDIQQSMLTEAFRQVASWAGSASGPGGGIVVKTPTGIQTLPHQVSLKPDS